MPWFPLSAAASPGHGIVHDEKKVLQLNSKETKFGAWRCVPGGVVERTPG